MADVADSTPRPGGQFELTVADLNTTVDHEARVEDVRLAEALEMDRPRDIRKLIERHREALERLGTVCATVAQTSLRGGRPGRTFWLNKRQALYLCTKSETPRATEATIAMVEAFDEHLRGTLAKLPKSSEVKGRRRALPKADASPQRFSSDSGVLLDLLLAVRSAIHRVNQLPGLTFGTALAETLEDIHARQDNPFAPVRGVVLDWNLKRATNDLDAKLRAKGRDAERPARPRKVDVGDCRH